MADTSKFPIDSYHFKRNSIFEDLPKDEDDMLKSILTLKELKKGDTVFVEGSYPSGIFYVIEGKIKKFKVDKDGREFIIYICGKGELLGHTALLCDEPFSDSAKALEKSIIGHITKKDFLNFIDKSTVLSRRLIKNLSHEFAVLENSILSLSHKTVKERLALNLLILKDKYNSENEIILSREDLANVIGSAVETLARMLTELKSEEIIKIEGRRIKILDSDKLLTIANL
jgi:CRP-like cAMP-binding protein